MAYGSLAPPLPTEEADFFNDWVSRLGKSLWAGAKAPGDAVFGRLAVPVGLRREDFTDLPGPTREEAGQSIFTPIAAQPIDPAVERATDLAGLVMGGTYAGAPAGAAGAGAVRRRPVALPMDEASRIARARELGFNINEPLYHGGGKSFTKFDPNKAGTSAGHPDQKASFFSSSAEEAGAFAKTASARYVRKGETPHEVFDPMFNTKPVVYDGAQVYPVYVNPGRQMEVDTGGHYRTHLFNDAITRARQEGYDSVRFKGVDEGRGPLDQVAVINPVNIRSVNAAFDPAKKGKATLLAELAALGLMPTIYGSLAPSGDR